MALREAEAPTARCGSGENGELLALGERDGRVPGTAGVDVGPGDQHRVRRLLEPARERRDRLGARDRAPVGPALEHLGDLAVVDLGIPVVHRDRDERRALGRQRRVVGGAGERERHVLGARGLEAPLHQRMRHPRGVAVGEVGLQRHQRAHLLAGGDHQRRVVGLGVEDRAHRVADAGRGVEVDQRRAAARLRVAVGHADDDRLLEAEDVGEVAGEVLEHRQLGRARVAEHGRHPVLAEELEGGVADAGHGADSMRPTARMCAPMGQYATLCSSPVAFRPMHRGRASARDP